VTSTEPDAAAASGRRPFLFLAALFALLGAAAGFFPEPLKRWRLFEALLLAQGAVMGAGLWLASRPGRAPSRGVLLAVLLAALAARIGFFQNAPSPDVGRYLWEGRVQVHGFNPYAVAPDDPVLDALRRAGDPPVNHPSWTAIYGPAAEGVFAALAGAGGGVTSWKLLVLAADLATLLLLLRGLRRRGLPLLRVVGYAWNPLILWSFAGEAHLDVLLVLPLVAALLSLERGRSVRAGLLLGLALLVKPVGLLFLPLLFIPRFRPRGLIAALLLGVAGYLPYTGAGGGLFASLTRFGSQMEFNSFPALFLGGLLTREELRNLGALALLLLALWLWRRRVPAPRAARLLAGGFLLAAPTVHPWYAAPLVACACLVRGGAGWWLLSVTLLLALETSAVEAATGLWAEPAWTAPLVYLPVLLYEVLEVLCRSNLFTIRRKPGAGEP